MATITQLNEVNQLQIEIDRKTSEIKTESYPMSIGELASLYQGSTNGGVSEIDIHPEFQRLFQWSSSQKTKFIESLLLGIPIPHIFVAQKPDGTWEVIDGTQRLSTIFQFMGILKDENGELVEPLILEATDYLPSLKGKKWHDAPKNEHEKGENELSDTQKKDFKRAKLDIKIILRGSNKNAKYEMFYRLNTGGTKASDQDVRNCLLAMENPDAFGKIKNLASNKNFEEIINLSDRDKNERYDLELVLRFLVLSNLKEIENLKIIGDLSNFLNNKMLEIVQKEKHTESNNIENTNYWNENDWQKQIYKFEKTFEKLNTLFGDNAFRKYDTQTQKYKGGFYIYAFEIIALGLSYHINKNLSDEFIKQKIHNFWEQEQNLTTLWRGLSGVTRVPKTISYGKKMFEL